MIINVKKQNTLLNVEKFSKCNTMEGTAVSLQYANDCGEFTACFNFDSESKAEKMVDNVANALENDDKFVNVLNSTHCTIGGGNEKEELMSMLQTVMSAINPPKDMDFRTFDELKKKPDEENKMKYDNFGPVSEDSATEV